MGTSRRVLAADSARDQIKQYIVDHQLTPGSPMPTEMVLCEELGVSRGILREAVSQLDALDIVDIEHGRGTFVGQISLQPLVNSVTFRTQVDQRDASQVLREIIDVRQSLDLGEVDKVVGALKGQRNEDLHELVTIMVDKARRHEVFPDEDRQFHTQLSWRATGNMLAQNLIGAFWDIHTAVIEQIGLPQPQEIADTAAAHGAMLMAAEAGDADAYREAICAHYVPLFSVLARADAAQRSQSSGSRLR